MELRKMLHSSVFATLLFLFSTLVYAQTKTITGRITDASGIGVPGATVTVKGTQVAAVTDAEGRYKINVPASANSLVISSVGFGSQEVNVGAQTQIDATLQAAASNLNEVVVVGYGTRRRRDLTGSITTVSSEDFQKGNITTPEQLISGKVAGVQITSNGGAPGAGSRIRIRGGASLNASNDPLIVIDGVPMENLNKSDGTSAIAGVANPLSLINPNDIESFNILKDASATAIYGSRASNGVIIITTKKGKKGKPVFSFNTQHSVSQVTKKVDVLTADEIRKLVNEKGNDAQKKLLGTATTDWQDEIYRTAYTTDNNLSVTGSYKNLPYRVSVGYLGQDGVLKTGRLDRGTAALNLNPRLLDNHLKIDLNLKGTYSKSRFANQDAISAAIAFDPTQPVMSKTKRYGGYYEWLDPSSGLLNTQATRNPVALLDLKNDKSTVQRSIGNIQVDYSLHFLPELHANLNVGYDISRGEGNVYFSDSSAAQYGRRGQNKDYVQRKTNKLLEFYLNYSKSLQAIKSNIDVVAGYGYQDFLTTDFNFPDRRANGDTIKESIPKFAYNKPQNTLISMYSRVNYSLMDKYLVTATVRRDGSSRFSEKNRWGTFPSVALAWKVKNEGFLRNSNLLSELKLRLGYGVTGQQDIIGENYPYLPVFALSENNAQYQLGETFYNMYRPSAYDENIMWEETETYNAGIDFGFKNNRVSGSVEYYFKRTRDLLSTIPIAVGSNFSNEITTNVGNVENRGVELTLNATPISNNDLSWDLSANFTYNRNEITNLTKVKDTGYLGILTGGISGATGTNLQIQSVGYNTYSFFVYKQVYGQDGNPLEGVYVDLNKDGIINEKDRYRYKSREPKFLLGLSSQLNYKKWSAGFVLRGSIKNYMYNNVYSNRGVLREILNPLNYLSNGSPNVLETNFTNNQFFSDYYVENASFLRMDNLNIGYNAGKVLRNKANLRLNANVQNVFVITKYQGLDPEIASGIDNNFYPRPVVFTVGANIDF